MTRWTDERKELLTQLWNDGVGAREIAAQLGGFPGALDGGKNAVIGQAHRMGLPKHSKSKTPNVQKIRKARNPDKDTKKELPAAARPGRYRQSYNAMPQMPQVAKSDHEVALLAVIPTGKKSTRLTETERREKGYRSPDDTAAFRLPTIGMRGASEPSLAEIRLWEERFYASTASQ